MWDSMMGSMMDMKPMMGWTPIFWPLGPVIYLAVLALLIWAVVDLAKSKQDAMTKVFWLLVITMAGNLSFSWLGSLIYLFAGRKK
ncbi:PLDc_N domain-containing protein [Candidatus Woesearchaeota archaeon]|nr:PLDc_N domain-containing protein [Candidatus Woesearchaeota archaeon]